MFRIGDTRASDWEAIELIRCLRDGGGSLPGWLSEPLPPAKPFDPSDILELLPR